MDLNEIKRLLDLMEAAKLLEFEYEEEGKKIRLRRADERPAAPPPAPAVAVVQAPIPVLPVPAVAAGAPAPAAPAAAARGPNLVEFKSPLVGTFYRAAKPEADPFVNPGDEVGPEKVICIIEAMKVMNEIKAETSGIVREILVKNGQTVEFGEVLFLIEKK